MPHNNKVTIVIGSGPSGANAALTLLEKGRRVVLMDVGNEEEDLPLKENTFDELKMLLPDPWQYLLGDRLQGIIPPGSVSVFEYPPSRNYLVREEDKNLSVKSRKAFNPYISHNRGGLGVAWGANCVPFDEDDFVGMPVTASEFRDSYLEMGNRLAIAGSASDRVGTKLGSDTALNNPLDLNDHDKALLDAYSKKSKRISEQFGITIGRSRMAVDTLPGSPHSCFYCNRCLWGCPRGAIYDPRMTLRQCEAYSAFSYRPSTYVTRLITSRRRVTGVEYLDTRTREFISEQADLVILAAGAIGSGAIFLRTLKNDSELKLMLGNGEIKTQSLLDTKVVKLPYIFLRMIGRPISAKNFQFNKLLALIENNDIPEYGRLVQGEILSLSSLMYHPLISKLPFGSRTSSKLFFRLKPSIGVVTIFLPDRPYLNNGMRLVTDPNSAGGDQLEFCYQSDPRKDELRANIVSRVRRALRSLGCIAPRNATMILPDGAGIHYAGTIPMSEEDNIFTLDSDCRSRAYDNLYVVDGSAFPRLPSKSLTLSLMANSVRVAKKL